MINNLEVNTNSNASQKFRFILIKIKTIIGQKKYFYIFLRQQNIEVKYL